MLEGSGVTFLHEEARSGKFGCSRGKVSCFVCQPPPAPLHAYTTYAGAREGRQTSAERVSGRGAHRHTPMTAAAEDWKRKVLSGWREHRPSYKVNRQDKTLDRQGLASDGHCVPFCPRWFLFNALLGIEAGGTPDSSSSDRAQAANHFRGQCPIPCPVVPVLSRCVGAGTPAVDRRPPFDLGRCVVVFRPPRRSPANQFRGQC